MFGELIDEKYKVSYTARINAKLLFSANKMPNTSDKSYGFLRRWLAIPFPHKFEDENKDVNLKTKLTTKEELEGAFAKAVYAIKRVEKTGSFSIPESSKSVIAEYQRGNDHIVAFCSQMVDKTPDGSIHTAKLQDVYQKWCELEKVKSPYGRNKFQKAIKKALDIEIGKKGTKSHFIGVSLRDHTLSENEAPKQVIDDGIDL